ncbi:phosphoribosyltransferase family protein [Oryzomicrobium sp.]|uniref:phosphoribosyltransferase family protein n=1 Tax=Oryzomicrobium sp. TaxID=1911578 RepID=UPI0025D28789|nr:phosphoribosyltransferase family protein [Oryzomicrobium sp.]MCE1243112.1 phosphoribosyltransferase [Oryzomicrobium sp.]
MERPAGTRTCLYSPAQLEAVVAAMAARLAPLVAGRPRLGMVGILRRGAPLADRLAAALVGLGVAPPLRLDLAIKRYADDLTLLHPDTRFTEQAGQAELDLAGYTLVVVDDVLYTGHSLLRAVGYLAAKGPAEIRVAVLVDRGVARLPLRTDVAGLRLDVAPPDVVECNVPPYEADFRIELLQLERRPAA